MFKYLIFSAFAFVLSGAALAARVPFDCKTPKVVGYKAELINDGTMNRSVQVTFPSKPSRAQATNIVQACVKAAVAKDGSVDALGSAWVGDQPINLSNGTYFAYISKHKKYQFM